MFKNNKLLPIVIVLIVALVFLGGCNSSKPTTTNHQPTNPQPTKPTEPAKPTEPSQPEKQATEIKAYKGLGQAPIFRVGPGKDEKDGQIYSINYVTASAIFDEEGKVIDVYFDGLEILSPNDKEHEGVPKFSGWPTQPAYLEAAVNTDKTAAEEVANWKSKRERGDVAYGMNWSVQMNNYQKFFTGKTVAEIEQWFAKNTSDLNGRPLTEKATKPEDQEKYNKLTAEEKAALADVTSGATISLKDGHGDAMTALKKAFENKVEITIPADKVYTGLGQSSLFRVGPGKDEKDGQIYSINYVTASAIFDKEGKVIDVYFDGLEILSPNDNEHEGVPKFSGWPTQPAYLEAAVNTNETAAEEVGNWKSKRERGDVAYGMNWSVQINNYQKFFTGKTVAEIEQWFAKNTSDLNGRPLTEKATKPEDQEKYNKLTAEEKTALADVTSGATISLKDGHGDLITALKNAFENKVEVSVK